MTEILATRTLSLNSINQSNKHNKNILIYKFELKKGSSVSMQ